MMTQEFKLPEVGSGNYFIHDGKITFTNISYDEFASDPFEWGNRGKMYSRGRYHNNFNPEKVRDLIENNPDAVPLDCYEHGGTLWGVSGELDRVPGVEFQWDGTRYAGVWVPDEDTLDEAKNITDISERRTFMHLRASGVLEDYNAYINGNVYCYTIITYPLAQYPNGENITLEDYYEEGGIEYTNEQSGDGYYGFGWFECMKEEIKSYIKHQEMK